MLDLLLLLFLALALFPVHHSRLLLLLTNLFLSLMLANLFQNITLGLLDKLLLELNLVFLATHPLLVRDGIGTLLANLAALHGLSAR